jgi:hypothetical protein
MTGTVVWGEEKCICILAGKPERKRLFGRPRHRWEDNVKIYLREIGCDDVGGIDLVKGGVR